MEHQRPRLGSWDHCRGGRAHRFWGRGTLVVLICLPAAGCFSHRPIESHGSAPGDRVRAHLASETALETGRRIGRPISTVEGRILFADQDSLRVDVGWRGLYAGTAFEDRRDTLTFRHRQILYLERRELSRERSAIVGLGVVAFVVAVFQWLDLGGGVEGSPAPGPPEV